MIRDVKGNRQYWEKWAEYTSTRVLKESALILQPSGNPIYEPQYAFDAAVKHLKLMLSLYSRGDPIAHLIQHFPGLLGAWELSNRLSDEICAKEGISRCRDWKFDLADLNHYIWCFWLAGLALLLKVPDEQWQRMLDLIGGEGQDALLDRVIATRQAGRKVATTLLHPAPYQRLLKVIDAPKEQQAVLLKEFLDHWYVELDRPKKRGADPIYYRPYWYDYGDSNFESGSYFGRWCIEAAVVAKAFNIDDNQCLGHEHYPGDLLRPEGASTHPSRIEPKRGFFAKIFRNRES